MRVLAIINPTAGGGRVHRLQHRFLSCMAAAGMACEAQITQYPGHGTELASQAAASGRWDAVVAVGGDGTVHETVNGLAGSDLPLGILPVGTGNDFARALGIPKDVDEAVKVLAAGHIRRVDLGEVNGRLYVQVCGVGFDAQVAAAVSANRLRFPGGGAIPYLIGIVQQMATYRNRDLTLVVDGQVTRQRSVMVAAGNSRFYAGGLKICPEAQVDDGLLDVCIVGDLSHFQRVRVLAQVFSGAHIRHPRVTYLKAATLRVEGPSDLLIHADGQIIGHLPASIRVVPSAARVFAPPPAPAPPP